MKRLAAIRSGGREQFAQEKALLAKKLPLEEKGVLFLAVGIEG